MSLSLCVLEGRGAVGFPCPFHLGSPSTQEPLQDGHVHKPMTNKHKTCAVEATYTVVSVLKKWVCASLNIW